MLTLASLLFYAAGEWQFVPLLLASVALNWWIALRIEASRGRPASRRWMIAGVVSDLALLFYFKYFEFFATQASVLFFAIPSDIEGPALPLGISFFTFHKISYKVDVYRGESSACRSPIDLSLYILLFPQLIAGPIIRFHEIADQLYKRTVSRADFAEGIRRFTVGLAKKVLIANVVAGPADVIFDMDPDELNMPVAWLGLICYTLQIYFDFSGYSDMAIGLGRMFGFRFPENFNYPYSAQSITDFWRRWHISLSRWFRDYVYVPLGGNRVPPRRLYANLLTVFVLCGFWHGAGWTFLAWGLLHGTFLVFERSRLGRAVDRLPAFARSIYTLTVIMAGWVFFRCASFEAAGFYFAKLAGFENGKPAVAFVADYLDSHLAVTLMVAVIASTPVWLRLTELSAAFRRNSPLSRSRWIDPIAGAAGAAMVGLLLTLCAMALASNSYNPFLYYRF